jgi:BolA family transcriptional regulator, general stress-responsive regulator
MKENSMNGEPNIAERIKQKLQAALKPVSLAVIDESDRHAGHAHVVKHAAKTGKSGETHFNVKVVSESFRGKSPLARHRMINEILQAEFADGVHALSIEARAPGD